MKDAVTQSLYSYWNGLRGDRLAPKRFEIEPSCIGSYLPDTFILERIDAEIARFRLAGTRICEAFGIDFRGFNIFDLFDADDRAELKQDVATIAGQGGVGLFVLEVKDTAGRAAEFEMLLMPLTHTRNVVDRFVGSMAAVGRPAWLGSAALPVRKLMSHEVIWPDGRPRAVIEKMHRQSPFLPQLREARIVRSNRRQFRVYQGGRDS